MMIRNFALFVLIGCATLAYGQSQKHPKLSTPQLVDFKVELPDNQYKNIFNKIASLSENTDWKLLNGVKDKLDQTHYRYQQFKHKGCF
jgi:uncharacterized protein YpuA (DUF1002 family)